MKLPHQPRENRTPADAYPKTILHMHSSHADCSGYAVREPHVFLRQLSSRLSGRAGYSDAASSVPFVRGLPRFGPFDFFILPCRNICCLPECLTRTSWVAFAK